MYVCMYVPRFMRLVLRSSRSSIPVGFLSRVWRRIAQRTWLHTYLYLHAYIPTYLPDSLFPILRAPIPIGLLKVNSGARADGQTQTVVPRGGGPDPPQELELELKAGAGAGARPAVAGFWDGSPVFGRPKPSQKYATKPAYVAKELEVWLCRSRAASR